MVKFPRQDPLVRIHLNVNNPGCSTFKYPSSAAYFTSCLLMYYLVSDTIGEIPILLNLILIVTPLFHLFDVLLYFMFCWNREFYQLWNA